MFFHQKIHRIANKNSNIHPKSNKTTENLWKKD
jgi:hypothetical protein